MALPGAVKNCPHACSTVSSLNAMSRPPSTTAAAKARTVTTAGLPSTTAPRITRLNEADGLRPAGAPPAPGPGPAEDGGGEAGCWSLMTAPQALGYLADPPRLPRPGPAALSGQISR